MKNSYYVEFRVSENWFSSRFTNKREAQKEFRANLKREEVNSVRFRTNGWLTQGFTRSVITNNWRNSLDLAILLKTPV